MSLSPRHHYRPALPTPLLSQAIARCRNPPLPRCHNPHSPTITQFPNPSLSQSLTPRCHNPHSPPLSQFPTPPLSQSTTPPLSQSPHPRYHNPPLPCCHNPPLPRCHNPPHSPAATIPHSPAATMPHSPAVTTFSQMSRQLTHELSHRLPQICLIICLTSYIVAAVSQMPRPAVLPFSSAISPLSPRRCLDAISCLSCLYLTASSPMSCLIHCVAELPEFESIGDRERLQSDGTDTAPCGPNLTK